jgi:hypothetical protein
MKKILSVARVAAGLFLVMVLCSGKDTCNSDNLFQQGLKQLKDYTLIKDYRVYLKKKKKTILVNLPITRLR